MSFVFKYDSMDLWQVAFHPVMTSALYFLSYRHKVTFFYLNQLKTLSWGSTAFYRWWESCAFSILELNLFHSFKRDIRKRGRLYGSRKILLSGFKRISCSGHQKSESAESDVTLAWEDSQWVEAGKIILAGCSPKKSTPTLMFELNGSYSYDWETKTATANRSRFWLPKIRT